MSSANPVPQQIPLETALQHAIARHRTGALDEAEDLYRKILEAAPGHGDALHLLGAVLYQRGRPADALPLVEEAMARNPNQSYYHNTRGQILRGLGRGTEGVADLETAMRLMPQNAEAHSNLGEALMLEGRFADAEAAYRRALTLRPVFPLAAAGLGMCLRRQGDLGGALPWLQLAAVLQPDRVDFALNLASTFHALGHLDLAAARYEQILQTHPQISDVAVNLASCQALMDRREDAIRTYREAWRRTPRHPQVLDGLYEAMRQACDWQDMEAVEADFVGYVRDALAAGQAPNVRGFTVLYASLSAREQRAVNAGISVGAALGLPSPIWRAENLNGGRLRVGYLSADVKEHPTAHLLRDLFRLHDRERVEVFLYSTAAEDFSPHRQIIQSSVEHFVECFRLPDKEIAERIAADGIQVLVDLMGHTRDNRIGVLARRPAPVQINYLGYPGSSGAEYVDYLIGDAVVTPQGEEDAFSERLLRLPHCYQINSHREVVLGAPASRSAEGLPEQGVVFCSMNNSYKIDPYIFDRWCRVLRETPGSVLWLLQSTREMQANLQREAEARGVEGHRMVFARRLPREAHLTRLQLADLFLDTRLYNAHTTATDALWAGVPVLTARGDTFAGRVAESALLALGFPEGVTADWDAYTEMALRLGQDAGLRGAWQERVRGLREGAALFDTTTTVRALEWGYERAWSRYSGGLPAEDLNVPA